MHIQKRVQLSLCHYIGLVLILLTFSSCKRFNSEQIDAILQRGTKLVGVTKDSLLNYYGYYGISPRKNWRFLSFPDSILNESFVVTLKTSSGFKTCDFFLRNDVVQQVTIRDASLWELLMKDNTPLDNETSGAILVSIVMLVILIPLVPKYKWYLRHLRGKE